MLTDWITTYSMQHCLAATFKNQRDKNGVYQFRNGRVDTLNTKMIPAWLVFANQNFLDIQHILKHDVSRGWQGLKLTFASILSRVQKHINCLAAHPKSHVR